MLATIRATWLLAAAGLTAAMLANAAPVPALAQAATGETGYMASAYGTEVRVASTVTSGRSALSVLGCTSQAGVTHTNTAASVSAPPALTTGTIKTSAASEATPGGPLATSKSTVQGANALGGLVTATAVRSVSSTLQNLPSGSFSTSAAGTRFVHLTVAGVRIHGTPAPNTKVKLAGIGYVILNQQVSTVGTTHADLTVIGIHLYVTHPNKKAKVGTQVIVAFASSGLGGPVTGLLDGFAYGTRASVAKTVIAGDSFPQPLGCLGTGGKTKRNSGAGVSIPGILVSGTVKDTASGVATASTASAVVKSTVQGLNLLTGTVRAKAIRAYVTANGNPPALGDQSAFVGLTVAGHPGIGAHVAPNTKLKLAGFGTLWLHRQIKTANKITVIMVQLVVTNPKNPAGLKVGTVVNIAYAQASVN